MQQLKVIEKELDVTSLIRVLAETYEEAATIEIKKTRDGVLTKRDFLLRLLEIYNQVKINYKSELSRIQNPSKNGILKIFAKEKNVSDFYTVNKSKEKATVLITSNRSMMGPVNLKVFSSFIDYYKENSSVDTYIIGKIGKNFFDAYYPKKKYTYCDLPENKTQPQNIIGLIADLMSYKKIDVFHGKYLNLLNQVEVKSNVTGDITNKVDGLKPTNKIVKKDEHKYLFEPSLKDVMNFFETQIFSSLFNQTLSETKLANLGSRINSMEQTIAGAEENLRLLKLKQIRAKKILSSKKQQQRVLASMVASQNGY